MREIKFRVWDKNRKKMWSHSDLYKMDCSNEYPFLALIKGYYATNMFPGEEMDVIPMQFTGLYDKNGKEVYEGDILLHPIGTKAEINYNNDFAAFVASYKFKGKCETDILRSENVKDCEVIGNIYEHKRLFEVDS